MPGFEFPTKKKTKKKYKRKNNCLHKSLKNIANCRKQKQHKKKKKKKKKKKTKKKQENYNTKAIIA